MSEIICASIPPDDAAQLNEVMGFHFRAVQPVAMQNALATITDDDVLPTLRRRSWLPPIFGQVISTFQQCHAHGGVFTARRDGVLMGYAAYSPIEGKKLNITHRANEPVALFNFFRVPFIGNKETANDLVLFALNELRDTPHFRIAYASGNTRQGEYDLDSMLKPTAYGFDTVGRMRVVGLNAADMSMGIYRRPAYLKGPSFLAPSWRR